MFKPVFLSIPIQIKYLFSEQRNCILKMQKINGLIYYTDVREATFFVSLGKYLNVSDFSSEHS